jgi:tetratricopeptide (TPR) repeat protein
MRDVRLSTPVWVITGKCIHDGRNIRDVQKAIRSFMNKNRFPRLIMAAVVAVVPVVLAGCVSRDMRLVNKGFSAIERGQLVEAEKVLLEAVQANPNNPYALLDLGTVYQRTDRFDQARVMFEKVIALDSKQKPTKHSQSVNGAKTLREIAEDNLKMLPGTGSSSK